ncbi:MAG: 30S ribosomal protein S1, partial [Acidobacteriaceae bacterium]|nr:30S ribosomal protein S1 [Acidobacteriaceae bacterium]
VDHYISEHQKGDTVSGRLIEVQGTRARVELGEGVIAICQLKQMEESQTKAAEPKSADVGSLGAMLAAKWKQGGGTAAGPNRAARAGEVRSFRIATLDPAKKLIELELAS